MSIRKAGVVALVTAAVLLIGSGCQTGRQENGNGMPADTAGMEQDTAMQDTAMDDTAPDTGAMEP